MKSFFKKFSPTLCFMLLVIIFSGVIWAINIWAINILSIPNSNSGWINNNNVEDLEITKANAEKHSYDKASESYVVAISTFGLITPASEGTLEGDGYLYFNIDGDKNANQEEIYDYKIKDETLNITVPLAVPLLLYSGGGIGPTSGIILSPTAMLKNNGATSVKVSIAGIKQVDENLREHGQVNLIENNGKLDKDSWYLGVTTSGNINSDNTTNAFDGELKSKEVSLSEVFNNTSGGSSTSYGINLGTLEAYNKDNSTNNKGTFLFVGSATKEFLDKHATYGPNTVSLKSEPLKYILTYSFSVITN